MNRKQQIREKFRRDVFSRDNFSCKMCGYKGPKINAHHIVDRNLMPSGGYVKENGITLCDFEDGCHAKAEVFHSTGVSCPGFSPNDLFDEINSSYEQAVQASKKL